MASAALTNTLALVREDEAWLLDEYAEVEITDRDRFEASLLATLTGRGGALHEPEARCLAEDSRDVPEERLERLAVKSAGCQFPVSLIRRCVGDGTPAGAAAELVRLQLEDQPEYADLAGCVARYVGAKLSAEDALALLRSEDRGHDCPPDEGGSPPLRLHTPGGRGGRLAGHGDSVSKAPLTSLFEVQRRSRSENGPQTKRGRPRRLPST